MGQVIDRHPKLLQKFAENFVRLYITQGPKAAGAWSFMNLTKEQRLALRPYVRKEFERNNWIME